MICQVCSKREFTGSARATAGTLHLSSGEEPLGRVQVTVGMTFTCRACGTQVSGNQTATIACRVDSEIPFPLSSYAFVRKSYGDGWNIRAKGQRLNEEERENPSMVKGWEDAQARSVKTGGMAPPKGFGHTRSKAYLKTETAWNHLRLISLSELGT